MSLKIKSITYDTVYLATTKDLQVFIEDLKDLTSTGYTLSIDVFATNETNFQQDSECRQQTKKTKRTQDGDDHSLYTLQ